MEGEKELNKREVELREGNISLVLNSYNDIFSDFDPRVYSERALSDDFLFECKKAARDKVSGPIELRVMVPHKLRAISDELRIRKRLKEHFKKHFGEKSREVRKLKWQGVSFIFAGILLMFLSVMINSVTLNVNEFVKNLILVITEPAGWFLFWIGGERFVYRVDEVTDFDFYKKMSEVNIIFLSY